MRYLIPILFCSLSYVLSAQIPPLSPTAKLEQVVGMTQVSLEYTRPMARGRAIFGGLVPYGKRWQTGAGMTIISFDGPVSFGEQQVPAGVYSLVTIPNTKHWDVILSRTTDFTAVSRPDKAKEVANLRVPVQKTERFTEALSISLDLSPGSALLFISWTDVQVSIPISTTALRDLVEHVDSLLTAPLAWNADVYFRAANYLLFNRQDLAKAIALTDRYRQLESGYFIHTMRRDIYEAMENTQQAKWANEEAIETAKCEFAEEPERLASIVQMLEAY